MRKKRKGPTVLMIITLLFSIAPGSAGSTFLPARETRGRQDHIGAVQRTPEVQVSVDEKNAFCLGCHSRDRLTIWNGITHELRGVACSECHGIHKNMGKR